MTPIEAELYRARRSATRRSRTRLLDVFSRTRRPTEGISPRPRALP